MLNPFWFTVIFQQFEYWSIQYILLRHRSTINGYRIGSVYGWMCIIVVCMCNQQDLEFNMLEKHTTNKESDTCGLYNLMIHTYHPRPSLTRLTMILSHFFFSNKNIGSPYFWQNWLDVRLLIELCPSAREPEIFPFEEANNISESPRLDNYTNWEIRLIR